jgi:hypothetical protein
MLDYEHDFLSVALLEVLSTTELLHFARGGEGTAVHCGRCGTEARSDTQAEVSAGRNSLSTLLSICRLQYVPMYQYSSSSHRYASSQV